MNLAAVFALSAALLSTGVKPDDSVRLVIPAKGRLGAGKTKIAKLPLKQLRIRKLTALQIKDLAIKGGSLPSVGVADFLHLDARTPYVFGKGSLEVGRCSTDLDMNYIGFDLFQGGAVTLKFDAKPEAARYLIDFQVSSGPQPVSIRATVDGNYSETTVNSTTQHLVYVVDCTGGKHTVEIWCNVSCLFLVTGVDVSVVK